MTRTTTTTKQQQPQQQRQQHTTIIPTTATYTHQQQQRRHHRPPRSPPPMAPTTPPPPLQPFPSVPFPLPVGWAPGQLWGVSPEILQSNSIALKAKCSLAFIGLAGEVKMPLPTSDAAHFVAFFRPPVAPRRVRPARKPMLNDAQHLRPVKRCAGA